MLGVPIGTVMSRISRGRRLLYERLAAGSAGPRGASTRADVVMSSGRRGASVMANCRDIEPMLAAYVDGEAAAAEARRRSRRTSRRARRAARASLGERAAHDVVCARRAAPPRLRARQLCAGAAPRSAAARRGAAGAAREARRGCRCRLPRRSVLAVAGMFLLFGLGSSVETSRPSSPLDHLKCFQFPPDASAVARRRRWSARPGSRRRRLGRSRSPRRSPSEQLELLGVRRCGRQRGRVGAHLVPMAGRAAVGLRAQHRFDRAPTRRTITIVEPLGEQAIVWSDARAHLRGRREPASARPAARRRLRPTLRRVNR